MGKANRQRRRAKLKDKERERRRRDQQRGGDRPGRSAGWHAAGGTGWQQADIHADGPSAAEVAEELISAAVRAQFRGDQHALGCYVERLADMPSVPGWKRIVERTLLASLIGAVTTGWHQGWQPVEIVRQVGREFGPRHARLATDLVAAEMRGLSWSHWARPCGGAVTKATCGYGASTSGSI